MLSIRRDVRVVSAPGDDDVVIFDRYRIGGVEVFPAEGRAAPKRHPRVRSVRSRETLFARRRDGSDITAYVKRGQGNAAHGGDHDMGEVLAYAAATAEGFRRRRTNLGCFAIIDEVGANSLRQLARRAKMGR